MSTDEKQICLYCKWWLSESFDGDDEDVAMVRRGDCRRHAPGRRGERGFLRNDAEFPRTLGDAWCGDFLERRGDIGNWQKIGDVVSGLQFRDKGIKS